MRISTLSLSLSLLLTACAQSNPPEPPHEPAADAGTPATQGEHGELREAIEQPIDRARAVEQTLQQDADATAKAIEDAGG